jgi:uncharacterized membrane protein YccC
VTERLWDNPFVRQAAQAGTGVALAIVVGTLISGQRWYWAVIAAFIVGTGVGSRSEVLIKALQRLLGTLAGIVVGILLASVVSRYTNLTLGLVLVCVFFAFYAFQAAYGVMMFCITLMLALLYGLVGQFEDHLLLLRLEETAAGAAIGLFASMTVLPIRESNAFRTAARDFLRALETALRQASGAGPPTTSTGGGLHAKVQALRHSVGAVKRGWIPLVPLRYRRAVRSAMRCAYLTRELLYAGNLSKAQAEALVQQIDATLAWLETNGASPPTSDADATPALRSDRAHEHAQALSAALDRLDQRLQQALDRTGTNR